ncbi:MAG TPA: outer membrane protein assembly factor BamE, partial [Nevskiaceae bacterium]|nr:outer membrane protein assembly factor BamE [Nevskiaceae bacterium]
MRRLLIACALPLLVLAGCGSRVNADNYAKLKSGMTQDEVHAILGRPAHVTGGGIGGFDVTRETFNGSEQQIRVIFSNGKLLEKSVGSVTDESPADKTDN